MRNHPVYATQSRALALPEPAPTDPVIFSVPRLSGGYDYYQSPPGVAPGQNNDWDIPNVTHPNAIGVSSLHIGHPLPPGSVRIGSGYEAIGSITPMPGAGGMISGVEALGTRSLRGLADVAPQPGQAVAISADVPEREPEPLVKAGAFALAFVLAYGASRMLAKGARRAL